MSILFTVFSLVLTLSIIVTIHEFGHFYFARRYGVMVKRFSVGFGKPLYSIVDKKGTEFSVAAIPLGGYVSMLDERAEEVPDELLPYTFNCKPVWQRMIIIAAGPIANFVLAILLYWFLFVLGVSTVIPVTGTVNPDFPAYQAGVRSNQELVSVDGTATESWQDIYIQLLSRMGETGSLSLELRELDSEQVQQVTIPISQWMSDQDKPAPLKTLGIQPYYPEIPAIIGEVSPDGRAAKAGLISGDHILSIANNPVSDWRAMVDIVRVSGEQTLVFEVERAGLIRKIEVIPANKRLEDGSTIGYLGVGVQAVHWPDSLKRDIQYSVVSAWIPALAKTWQMTRLTFDSFGKMLTGLVSVKNLGGPISIARMAEDNLESGFEAFLGFIAYFSISLGILNLLPIPVLDGGHLFFYTIEWITGKPVPEKAQMIAYRVGILLVGTLMFVAIYNDLLRL
ncbi:MAG: RIP metalloprotease RseP [Pseudomonadales bacterium]|nr:RIP metalloprotease RseP [Pseudomonadales bacterium]